MQNPIKQAGVRNKILGWIGRGVKSAPEAMSAVKKEVMPAAGNAFNQVVNPTKPGVVSAMKGWGNKAVDWTKNNPGKAIGVGAAGTAAGAAAGATGGYYSTTNGVADKLNNMDFIDLIKLFFKRLFGDKFTGSDVRRASFKKASAEGRPVTNYEVFEAIVAHHCPGVTGDVNVKAAAAGMDEIDGLRDLLSRVPVEQVKQAMLEFRNHPAANEPAATPSSLQRVMRTL